MSELPNTLEEAIAQAKAATQAALEDGYTTVQVELVIPEIPLKAQAIAWEFTSLFPDNPGLKVFFPDTGAAALAKRDWGDVPFAIEDIGTNRSPVDNRINPEDQCFLVVSPSAVEVSQVEKLCNLAADRPVVLLIPQLEDVSIVGIGYAARQLRERFLSTLYTSYYLKPLDGAAVTRIHPGPWRVWLQRGEDYELVTEVSSKPVGEALERLLYRAANPEAETEEKATPAVKKPGILGSLQRFLKALSS